MMDEMMEAITLLKYSRKDTALHAHLLVICYICIVY